MASLLSESTQPLPIHRKILLFSWLGWVFDFYSLNLLNYLIASTPLSKDLGLTKYQESWLLGSSLGFTAVGGLLCGWLADRYGRKPLLAATILIYSVGTGLCALTTGPWTMLVARAITGIGVGGEWAVAHTLVGETVPPHVRGRYGAYLQTGATFGLLVATACGNFLAPVIGWRWTFALSSLPVLLALAAWRFVPESDIWEQHRGEHGPGGHFEVAALFGPALRVATMLAFAVTLANMAGYWLKNVWLPTYYHKVRGFSLEDSATLLFVGHVGSIIGYVIFGFSSDHFGRRPSFSVFAAFKAVCLAMLTVGWAITSGHPLLLFSVVFILGLGEGNWACMGPLLSELFPTRLRAGALGIIYNFSRGVQFIAPVLITLVAEKYTFAEGIALGAVFAGLAGALVWLLPETKGKVLAPARAEAKSAGNA